MHHKKHPSFNRWISMLYRLRDHYLEHELHPDGIGAGQMRILIQIHKALHHDHKEITQTGLARHMHLDKGAMARSIKKLEEEDYVHRERADHDHREYKMTLTHRAFERIRQFKAIQRRWGNMLSHDFSPEEQKQALAFLERMAHNADTFVHTLHEEGHHTHNKQVVK
ncbi:MarR family winged helix-turn-helix transcriptional regulator [Planctomycetota bacterium]